MLMTPKHRQRYAAFFVPLLAVFALTAVIPATVQAHPETAGHHDDPAHPHDQSDSKGGSNLGNEATNPEATMNSPVPVNGNSAPPSLTSTRKPEACSGGLMVYQNWDVASTRSDAADVNNANIQPIFTCHFDKGWYVGLPDLPQTYNNETNAWTAQIGGVVGRVFPWKRQHLQIFGGVYYNSKEDDDVVAAEWTAKINVSFLLRE